MTKASLEDNNSFIDGTVNFDPFPFIVEDNFLPKDLLDPLLASMDKLPDYLHLNSNNAYHGTGSFSGERKFIYFAIAAAGVESAFKSKYSKLLGDRNKNE